MVEQGRTRILFPSGLTLRCEQIFPHRCCFQPVRRIRQRCPYVFVTLSQLSQWLAALDQALNRLDLVLPRKPSPGSSVCHSALLGCSGSLQNPPLRGLSRSLRGLSWSALMFEG